jgi:hypothetical protein
MLICAGVSSGSSALIIRIVIGSAATNALTFVMLLLDRGARAFLTAWTVGSNGAAFLNDCFHLRYILSQYLARRKRFSKACRTYGSLVIHVQAIDATQDFVEL